MTESHTHTLCLLCREKTGGYRKLTCVWSKKMTIWLTSWSAVRSPWGKTWTTWVFQAVWRYFKHLSSFQVYIHTCLWLLVCVVKHSVSFSLRLRRNLTHSTKSFSSLNRNWWNLKMRRDDWRKSQHRSDTSSTSQNLLPVKIEKSVSEIKLWHNARCVVCWVSSSLNSILCFFYVTVHSSSPI